jgi:hypothetical protein
VSLPTAIRPPATAVDNRPVVYLHIGSPKSGTTYLQAVMWRNAGLLADQGVMLAGDSFFRRDRPRLDLQDVPYEPTDPATPWEGEWARLCRQVLQANQNRAVFSNEMMHQCDEARIKRAIDTLAPAEVHVIYTMRDLGRLLPSEWQERIKHRCSIDYETWLSRLVEQGGRREQGCDYVTWRHKVNAAGADCEPGWWFALTYDAVEILRRWSSFVPSHRIHVITVPPAGAPRDLLWSRFASLIGIDPVSVDTETEWTNASMSTAAIEFVRRVNIAIDPETPNWAYTTNVLNLLAEDVLRKRCAGGGLRLPDSSAKWATERSRQLIEGIRADGYHVIGDLDELMPRPSTAHNAARPADISDAELLDAAVQGVFGLLDHVTELRTEVIKLRKDLRARPIIKILVSRLSGRFPAIRRVRVAYWHVVEWARRMMGREIPEDLDKERESRFLRTRV